ncbi:MAG: Crp/Fnr family transcriptional regulator [Pseudorhodobacter sp.]|nr:Crp/Fnr family transcriptional regulator [Pseudorhodobacter sp.]
MTSQTGCAFCEVRLKPFLAGFPTRAIEHANRVKQRRTLPEGAVVFSSGDQSAGIYCLSRGVVGIFCQHENGTEVLVALAFPGDTLGARAYLRNGTHRTTAKALVSVDLCVILRGDALQLAELAPEMEKVLIERCLAALDAAQTELLQNAALSNTQRLRQVLYRLCGGACCANARDLQLRLPMSRVELAGMLGIQPESLSRLMRKLTAAGLITLSGRHLTVHRPDLLGAGDGIARAPGKPGTV